MILLNQWLKVMDNKRPTWAEIDLAAIRHNIELIKRKTKSKIMAVIKADAYGHGADEVCRVCVEKGVDYLGVASLDEALHLRDIGAGLPILIFGYVAEPYLKLAIEEDISMTVYNLNFAEVLAKNAQELGKKALVHIKVDTGMGRLGFNSGSSSIAEIKQIAKLPGLKCEGIYTHFASADQLDKSFTNEQLGDFKQIVDRLEKQGVNFALAHAANSAAILDFEAAHLDMVRAGIILYGLSPSAEVFNSELIPALRLKSKIIFLKEVAAGSSIGYSRTYKCNRPTKIATVPIGYADGYSRILSNRAWGIVKGQKVPLVGNVCMDQSMFDVSMVEDVQEGDEIVLIGRKEDGVTADDLADIMATISYEVVSSISSRVPRIYI